MRNIFSVGHQQDLTGSFPSHNSLILSTSTPLAAYPKSGRGGSRDAQTLILLLLELNRAWQRSIKIVFCTVQIRKTCVSQLFPVFVKAPHLVPAVEKCILYFQYGRDFSYCSNKWASIAAKSIPSSIPHLSSLLPLLSMGFTSCIVHV